MSDSSRENLLKICIKSMQKKGLFDDCHKERLKKEINEIDNQAEYEYFINLYKSKTKFPKNENNLLIAYLLDLVEDFDIKQDVNYQQGEFPDIDVDYLPVIQEYLRNEWCPKTFGRDNVVNIGNYGTFGIKSALLDMTRVHGIDRSEIQFITKNLQDKDEEGKPITWDKALEITPALQEYDKKYPEVTDAAKRIINRIRNRGKHAGGTVISSSKIDNLVPVMTDTDGNPVSGWTEGLHDQDLQPVGLIKFDILAIKDLLRIANCCNLIKKRHGIKFISALEGSSDWSDISYLNDKKAIELANEAKTRAIFQFDSEGMRNLLKSGGVDSFDDLVAYTALFRPSALKMQMHERYIQRKKGNETWEDQVPDCIKNILKKTQGVLCIHEDAMVSLYNGTEKKISQINVGDLIHTYNESKKVFEPKRVQWAGFTKKDNGLKIKLKNGFEITTTEDHEILTYYGWKMAKDLVPEDLVAIPKKLSKKSNTNNIAKWLGIKTNNLTKRGLQRTTGISRQHFKKNKNKNICLSSIENIVPKSNLLFVEVSNIEKVYNKNFYDISLEDNHNFVANGIVVHNCYQEQCMQVLNVIGDIPLIHCEKIRKAISKKKEKEFLKYKEMFLENGSKKTGWPIQSNDNKNINFIWDQLEAFSGYGFNKSHACAYTYISSRLLYLKAHYPLEFFAVTLSLENDENKLRSYKREAEKLGIKVNKCNLNKSKANFEIIDDEIYIGFSNIKGIGVEVAERIVKNQPYAGLEDFLNRATLDKRIVEPLILLGVFDDKNIGEMIKFYEQFKKKIKSNQEREKRHVKRRDELIETLKTFLKNHNEEILNHDFLMDLYNNSKEAKFKESFENFINKEFDLSDVWQVIKKYAKSTNAFNQKTELEKEYAIALENLENNNFKLNQFEIEKRYYGFSWKHPIENSPDFIGDYSFSRFKEDESIFEGGVEVVVVKKPVKKSSKNGKTTYYNVIVEDEDWNTELVIFWQADYERFKEELEFWEEDLQRGNFLRLRVIRPNNGFKSYTFQSPPKKERYLLPIKEKDYRLQVMKKENE